MRVRLAISGTGFLAPAPVGAVSALADQGAEFIEVAGTSGGSIVAALIAIGHDAKSIKTISLMPIPNGIMRYQPFAVFRRAMNNGKVLQRWLDLLFGDKTFADCTLPLTIMATDIEGGIPVEFSTRLTPSIRLADACRASASVPFIWAPKRLLGREFIDGGMCNNIPVDRLINDSVQRIGLQIVDGTSAGNVGNIFDYAKQCIGTMLGANEGNLIAWAEKSGAQIIPISAVGFDFLNANLSNYDRLTLFQRGVDAVTAFLKADDLPPLE